MGFRHAALFVALIAAADAASAGLHARLARLRLPSAPVVAQPARPSPRPEWQLPPDTQLGIERRIELAIDKGEMPGAVVVVGTRDRSLFRRAFGLAAVEPVKQPLRPDAIFDLASVTKAVVTATSVAALVGDGLLGWDDPAARYLPALSTPDKRAITLRHLLTHTSGLPADNAIDDEQLGLGRAVAAISGLPLASAPGERYRYSDLGFILLGAIVEARAKQGLDAFAQARLFGPLGLESTGFRPLPSPRLVPTEKEGEVFLRGVVHDPRARALGGVAGHAGAFSSADDLARFARMLLGKGQLDGVRVLSERSVREMTAPIEVDGARVTLGWDSPDDPARSAFSGQSFGHEGFTGTSLWIDPTRDRFVVFLSSRLHPDGRGRVAPLAQAIRAEVAGVEPVRAAPTLELGIDRLQAEGFQRLAGKRVALLTHDAARDRSGGRTTDVLFAAEGVRLVRLFAPEHGLGARQEGAVTDAVDARTGLPVFSVYGGGRDPSTLLGDVDLVVIDLVDVGARFFTYEASMLGMLRAATRAHKAVLVLDRPNPLGGERVEGPRSFGPRSSVDPFPLPVVHGLSLGELARLFRGELALDVGLEVEAMQGWRRDERFADTGLEWYAPSPNLRSPRAAELYPGVALFELTNLSVGRGTPTPFELLGAPWLDAAALSARISAPGVKLVQSEFVSDADPYRGERCHGVRFVVTDPARFSPIELGFALGAELRRLHPGEWEPGGFDDLLHAPPVFLQMSAGRAAPALVASFEPEVRAFRELRRQYLLYE